MKYTIHRFTAVILMFAAVLFCFPQSTLAETYTSDKYSGQYSDGTYEYSVKYNESEQTYFVRIDSVIDGNALSGDIVIPGTLQMSDGTALTVTEIGDKAFSGCYMIESVTIPNGVITVGDSAFSDCGSLTSVTIPNSVSYISEYAFYGCKALEDINVSANNDAYSSENGVLFNNGKTALIKYPPAKTETEYAIPDSVVFIGVSAFSYCYWLKSIVIPNKVKYIEDDTFYGCYLLTTVKISSSVVAVSELAFQNCGSLTTIDVDSNNSYYSSKDGVLFNKNKTMIIKYPMGKTETEYAIPESVTTIGRHAFLECKMLESVTIPNSVTTIDENAFACCSSLTKITVPNSVTDMGKYVFDCCYGLTDIVIPVRFRHYELGEIPTNATVHYICKIKYMLKEGDKLTELGVFDIDYGEKLPEYSDLPNPGRGYRYVYYNQNTGWKITFPYTVTYDMVVFAQAEELYFNVKIVLVDSEGIGSGSEQKNILADSLISEIITEDSGYDYTYKMNDRVCDKNVRITSDCTITVRRTLRKYTVTFVGDITDTQLVAHSGKIHVNEEYGYTYTYTVGGEAWDQNTPITSDLTVTVTKTIKTYTVTFIGDITDTQTVTHGGRASVSEEDGYIYTYTVGGEAWDQNIPITSDLTVTVTKTIKTYTVTFVGDWNNTEVVNHGDTVKVLAAPGETYAYEYRTGSKYGEIWDTKTPIKSDLTVYVTKVITAYRVTFYGDWECTQIVDKNACVERLPQAEDGYVYVYEADGITWNPKLPITSDITVRVKKYEDITEVTGIYGCDDISIDNKNRVITATVYNKTLLFEPILLGNKARAEVKIGYRVVYNTGSDKNTKTELDYGENEYTLTVWAESGRTAEYKLKLNLEKLSDIGYMTALTYGRTIGFKPAQRIKGNPIIKVRYSTDNNAWKYIDAEYNSDVNMIYVKNLASKTTYYFMIEADYGYEKYVCNTNTPIMAKTGLSDECLLIRTKNPPSTDIDHENGTVSGLWVQNVFDTCIVDVDVSDGATWEMFLTPDMNIPSYDREVSLKEGKTTNVYIRVTAEDGISSKIYTLPIYRWTKSEKPRVGVTDGLVSMTAREGSVIYYTTDNSYPTPGSKNTMIYTGPFLCADRTNVKAIAKDADRDEASDPVGYEVRGAARTAMTSAAFSAAAENEYSYEISLETLEASGLNGVLYIAAYDKDGVLTALEKVTVSTANRKYLASGKFYTVQKPERYAAFFLDSYMKPIARMRSI